MHSFSPCYAGENVEEATKLTNYRVYVSIHFQNNVTNPRNFSPKLAISHLIIYLHPELKYCILWSVGFSVQRSWYLRLWLLYVTPMLGTAKAYKEKESCMQRLWVVIVMRKFHHYTKHGVIYLPETSDPMYLNPLIWRIASPVWK